jgi:starch synthase (maltosyl-transferring)
MNEKNPGNKRIIIDRIDPEIDCGRFPVKRITGDKVTVEADIFTDGHDVLTAVLKYRREWEKDSVETPMEPLVNDRWSCSFVVKTPGKYAFTISAWINRFGTWQQNLEKKANAKQSTFVDFIEGAELLKNAIPDASAKDKESLLEAIDVFVSDHKSLSYKTRLALGQKLTRLMNGYPDTSSIVTYFKELEIIVDPVIARFSSWYEIFPRSCAENSGEHGTFGDCERWLPYIAGMGFDVLYFPPIHPIGITSRKGKNNTTMAMPDDPGTPWAIGSIEGGHKAIHPQLGTLQDFRSLLKKAREYRIEIALDIAFQCSPDHPYVKEHPEWFRWRPDGTVQYAENPPKKYQDIYPLNFETGHWKELWEELKSIVDFWIGQGVRIFRVDNPHTKPFDFLEWLITDVKQKHPEIVFLAEAFTRPKIMYRLAKLGFNQSYTYFSWRNNKWEIIQYLTELTKTEVAEFFRPNFWPNTPDILSDYLRDGGRPAFMSRLVLAATLSSNYGIYGPAFELCENRRKDTESEEYLNSEKYELKHWNTESPDSLKEFITRINLIRRENPALQRVMNLHFHTVDNDQLICYTKHDEESSNILLIVVNLDYRYKQSGWVHVELDKLAMKKDEPYDVHDLLTGTVYKWQGSRNYVELDPEKIPAHILKISRFS